MDDTINRTGVIPTTGTGLTKAAIGCGIAALVLVGATIANTGDATVHEHLGRLTAVLIVTAAVLTGQVVLRRDLHRNRQTIASMVHAMAEADVRHQAELHRVLGELSYTTRQREQAVREAREEGRIYGRTEIKQVASAQITEMQRQHQAELEQAVEQARAEGFTVGYKARDAEINGGVKRLDGKRRTP